MKRPTERFFLMRIKVTLLVKVSSFNFYFVGDQNPHSF
ncbi:hypothetical protein ADICYQ_0099 [Cyclobacterium qasimii M12-11B]|uniref:Uncharacterized protein n=1 Tax=Cyclobacterium qasimii M12-11B TaxID=641524 RepID=S7VPG0_9BACT|nr:hypothetical protein ADICYQ_0099 [Cyclobacterium qasimii M12-11B]